MDHKDQVYNKVHIIAVDELVMQGVKSSTVLELILPSQNTPAIAPFESQ